MTGHAVPEAAIYYASSKRRRLVPITPALRAEAAVVAGEVRAMLQAGRLPPPLVGDKAAQRCRGCSLRDRCQPETAQALLPGAPLLRDLFEPDPL